MLMFGPVALSAVLVSGASGLPGAAAISPGTLVEHLPCAEAAGQSYTLYLPTAYRPDRPTPILYALDPRARGRVAAERFLAAAERYGWIIASSENSASDGPFEVTRDALRAMWGDTHARFAIDDARVYAAGFSGTVRVACTMADMAPGSIAGVIGAGAGFAPDRSPRKDTSFAFFGTVGNRDFNYYEMVDLDRKLAALSLSHRIEIFDGTHEWMPEGLASRAIEWMELVAIRRGKRAESPAFLDAIWRRSLEEARDFESAGKLFEAWHTYASLAADFDGLTQGATSAHFGEQLADVVRKATTLASAPAIAAERRRREAQDRDDLTYLARARSLMTRGTSEANPWNARRAILELRIDDLKRRAASDPDAQQRLSAKRLLNSLLVQTSFYMPSQLMERKQYDQAIFSLEVAAEITPEDPDIWYQLAVAYGRKGTRKRALEMLKRAIGAGWNDRSRLAADPAFDSVRNEEGFQRLLASLVVDHTGSSR